MPPVMTPLDSYFDHGQRPRNMGRMLDAHGTGNIGSIVSGRALRWFVTLDGEQVAASKFQVFACQEQVAAASILSELVVGKTVDECLQLGHRDIAAAIGGLDLAELPPQLWGVAALHDALAHIGHREGLLADLDESGPNLPLICRCHGVDEPTIKELVRGGAHDLAAIQQHSAVGTGCGTCRRDVERIIQETLDAPPPSATAGAKAAAGAKGRVAMMRAIMGALQPILDEAHADAAAAEVWDLRGNTLVLRVESLDDARMEVLQDRCERRLKDEVDPLLTVILETRA